MPCWSDAESRDRFFEDLQALENLDNESEIEYEDVLAVFKGNESQAAKPSACILSNSASKANEPSIIRNEENLLKKSASDPALGAPKSDRTTAGTKRKATEARRPSLKTRNSDSSSMENKLARVGKSLGVSSSGKTLKKARRLTEIPDEDKVFQGLNFFFLPNDNVNQQRRMRIEKVEQYGGNWVRECTVDKTDFVVLEKDLKYEDLLRWMKWDSCPDSILVIDEKYIGACITGKILLDANCGFLVSRTEKESHRSQAKVQLETVKPKKQVIERATFPIRETNDSKTEEPSEDALTKSISEAKMFAHLPLEDFDNEPSEGRRDIDSDTRLTSSYQLNQSAFQCMHKNGGKAEKDESNPNFRTIEILDQMTTYYDNIQDNWRTLAYRKAVGALKRAKTKISKKEEALKLPGIGDRLAAKIEEIVTTNNLRQLESTKDDPNNQVLQLFMGIYGIGYSKALQWVNAGYRTLKDLSEADLTENQKIGIEHYDDFNSRIPRAEVEKHGAFVRDTLHNIDDQYEVTIMGSYRRGADSSGDIDLIITKPGGTADNIRAIVVNTLVPRLFKAGFLKAGLATTNNKNGSKWHGASALPGSNVWRRIDFLLVPWDERGAAMIYFTGNDIFNRSIRLLASKKHMRLNQRGLYKDVMRDKGKAKVTEGELVEGCSERRIFEILGVPWRPPKDRNC